jgi:hypothetical protein
MIYTDLPKPCKNCIHCNVIPSCETKYTLYKDYICYAWEDFKEIEESKYCASYYKKDTYYDEKI